MSSRSRSEAARAPIARAYLRDGTVHIEEKAPQEIRLRPGQALHVQLQYRFEESSREKEHFHVRLRSHIGSQRPPDETRDFADRPILSDAEWGFIEHKYVSLPEGHHKLAVDVHAEYGVGGWEGSDGSTVDRAHLALEVPVVVEGSG